MARSLPGRGAERRRGCTATAGYTPMGYASSKAPAREPPSRLSRTRSRRGTLVAATTRMSTLRVTSPPRRSKVARRTRKSPPQALASPMGLAAAAVVGVTAATVALTAAAVKAVMAADELVEELGLKVIAQYALMGQYDFINIIEAPDEATMAKAAVMLRLIGLDSYLLSGGYNAWHQHILNPDIPAQVADDETPQVALQRAIACHFTGASAQAPAEVAEPVKAAPAFTPPVFTPPAAPEEGGLIVDEGC